MSVEEFLVEYQATDSDQPILYNFWASWCGPCVKELPYFESLSNDEDETEIKVVLVSLDFGEERLLKFLEKQPLQSEVIFLTDWSGADEAWISTVHPDWSGAIPITTLKSKNSSRAARLDAFENEADLLGWLEEHTK